MVENNRQQQRNAAIVAFISVVAAAVVVEDETANGKVSVDEFLETLDQALNARLSNPDGAALAEPVRTLCDIFRSSVRRKKSRFFFKREIDGIFEDNDDSPALTTGERKVEVSVVRDGERALEALRELMSPGKVTDDVLYTIAAVSMYRLIHRATVSDCPHAKHALEHIGFAKTDEAFERLREMAWRLARD